MDKHARESPRKVGNHTFTLTEDHLSPDEIQLLKLQFDERSSAALQRLQEIYKDQSAAKSTPDGLTRLDLYAVLRDNHKTNPVLASLWDEMYTVPSWVDWDQIDRGQRVFYRYGVANMIGFALQGFMGENAASPGIAEVLVRTGGFSTSVVLRRAVETFQWLLQVTRSVEDIKPGGEGHISTTRVRLLHASVRARVTKLAESKPDYLDVEKYGLPVNSLDDIHSIALFACNPMWLQLPVMGVNPRSDEIDDYVALFRYIGYLLAVPDRFFATTKAARMTMEAMCVYERRPTEASAVLCHNFIQALADVPPFNISAGFVEAGARVVNGDELSDAEGIGKPGWLSYVEFRGFCWLAQLLTAVQRIFPSFDNYVIKVSARHGARHRFQLTEAFPASTILAVLVFGRKWRL